MRDTLKRSARIPPLLDAHLAKRQRFARGKALPGFAGMTGV